jgi:hypothetical protein
MYSMKALIVPAYRQRLGVLIGWPMRHADLFQIRQFTLDGDHVLFMLLHRIAQ